MTSAPDPAVVGIAKPYIFFMFDFKISLSRLLEVLRLELIFAKSITHPPPIAIIISGLKIFI